MSQNVLTRPDVQTAWFALVGPHLPLRGGKDRVYVSAEAISGDLIGNMRVATHVDVRLRGLEMRLERDCR